MATGIIIIITGTAGYWLKCYIVSQLVLAFLSLQEHKKKKKKQTRWIAIWDQFLVQKSLKLARQRI